ncbi:MAG: hypothetical protein Q8P56_04790 [Candidatus Uhrbacteria bacterium]|nr:hypothetical protein [Candidatus Uhrbacteria bacterium]
MTLELTPKQYETLLNLAYLGDWMINGIRTEDERIAEYSDFMQRLFARAQETECGSLVEFDKKLNRFFPTAELEEHEDVKQYREAYDDEIFWSELIDKLSLRDFMASQEAASLATTTPGDSAKVRSDIIKKYVTEFEKNGINNVIIKNDAV